MKNTTTTCRFSASSRRRARRQRTAAGPTRRGPTRAGRALIECVVSMFLLAVIALATAASTRGTLALADDAALVTHAQALAVSRAEDALTATCATNRGGVSQRPRIDVSWQQQRAGSGTLVHLDLMLARSPIAFSNGAPVQLSLEAGGVCP